MFDILIALLGLVMIFGAAHELGHELKSPDVLFVILPTYFNDYLGYPILGLMLFGVLYLAAVLSTLGLMEVLVTNVQDGLGLPRQRAVWLIVAVIMCSVGAFLVGSELTGISKIQMVVWIDRLVVQFGLPCVGGLLAWWIQKYVSKTLLRNQFIDEDIVESRALYSEWRGILRWFMPVLVFMSLLIVLWSHFIHY